MNTAETTGDPGPHLCVHELVEAQANRTPDAPAAAFAGQILSYRELNDRADRFAQRLRGLGVGPEVPVGVFMERSLELAVAVLGLFKAGGAFLPLDPDYPPDRLAFLVQDAHPLVVATHRRLLNRAPIQALQTVSIDLNDDALGEARAAGPASLATGENVCALIYTSGSTGVPKAVLMPHRVVASRLLWCQAHSCTLLPSDRLLLTSSLGQGSFLGEFFAPLMAGATVVFARPGGHQDVGYLADRIAAEGITAVLLAPSMLRLLLQEWEDGPPARCHGLRHISSHGEALPGELQERLRTCLSARVHKYYGLTEAPVATYWDCRDGEDLERVTIGRPTDMRLHLLDDGLQPVAPGAVGEIHLAGPGLARGYLNRPGLTAERFLPNPFAETPGERCFRTGDLARWLPNGVLEFLGRVDQQVNLHGMRIELPEIEAALAAHPAVEETAVVLRRGRAGGENLAAFLVPRRGQTLTEEELRTYARAKLPASMVPPRFVVLDAMPRNAHGKLDRTRMAEWTPESAAPTEEIAPPEGRVERTLAGIWADVLGLEQVGRRHHFLDLGGDSIRAIQVVSRAGKAGLRITPAQLFEYPTIAELAEVAEGSFDGREGVAEGRRPSEDKLTRNGESSCHPYGPNQGAGEDAFPLSPAQQGMLFHTLHAPEAPMYFNQAAYSFRGSEAEAAALRSAWDQVVGRHAALRTSFRWQGAGEPLQVVSGRAALRWDEHDWRGLPAPERQAQLESFLAADRGRRFDLAQAPLLRLALIRTDEEEYQVVCSHHHLVLDGWSAALIAREASDFRAAQLRGESLSLDPPPPYRDYILWLRRQDLSLAETYWRRTLKGFTAPIPLPGGPAPTAPMREQDSAQVRAALPQAATTALQAFCRGHRLTLNTVVQGAWAVLLSRYSGTTDVVFGAVVSGRPPDLPGAESMVGSFINTLPVRAEVPPGAVVLPWLRELQARLVELRRYEYSPLLQVQGWSEVPRDRPLFESLLVFQNASEGAAPEGEGRARDDTGARLFELTNYPLDVSIRPGDCLRLDLQYDRRRFDPVVINGMLSYLMELLQAFAASPEGTLGTLPSHAESDRLLLAEWNAGPADFLSGSTLTSLLEGRAQETATAVVHGEQQITYRELHARANRLAHDLRRRGVGPDVPVGLCMGRSIEFAVGLLAVLKAGGACVPLDPTYPSVRLAFMLQDAGVAVLLTQRRWAAALPPGYATIEVVFDSKDDSWERAAPAETARPGNIAYVVYTSGSTGRPRGVLLTHAGLANLALAARACYGLTADDRVLHFYSPSVDVVAEELFPTWLAGGAVVLRPEDRELSAASFLPWLREQGITVLNLPTAFWKEWLYALEARPETLPEALRLVVVGGEAACPRDLEVWRRLIGARLRWINAYGPSEATVTATAYELPPDRAAVDRAPVPIGRPLANVQAYVLDGSLRPAPVGVAGELHLGGAGLARGYLNLPGWTAEKFVPNPFARGAGERLYKTGDRARWLPSGDLEFLGRRDDQVKIRGFRLELAEVEEALRLHPAVREAAALVQEDPPGDRRLKAYVAAPAGHNPSGSELRDFLKGKLPDFMLPTGFFFLDHLPRMFNGKVDRQALSALEPKPPDPASFPASPRTALEEELAALWAELLEAPRVGVRDNFFELGGHSLLVMRLFGRIAERWGIQLPLAVLFEGPTVEQLASAIRDSGGGKDDRVKRPGRSAGVRPPLFCLNYGPTLSRRLGPDRPVFALSIEREEQRRHAHIQTLAAALVKKMRGVRPEGPYFLCGFCEEGVVAIEMSRQLAECGQPVAFLGLIDCVPFPRLRYAFHPPGVRRWSLNLLNRLETSPAFGLPWAARWARISATWIASGLSSRIRPDPRWGLRLGQSIQAYRPSYYPDHVAVFLAAERPRKLLDAIQAGWAGARIRFLDIHTVPGNHFTMGEEPHASVLGNRFQTSLAKVAPAEGA